MLVAIATRVCNGFQIKMDRQNLYKARRIPKLAESLAKRCQDVVADRQKRQRDYFWSKRGQTDSLTSSKSESLEKKKNMRAEMFKKWKEEKLRKLEEEKQKKKPIFKVGVVQRTATGSPLKIRNNGRKQVRGIEINQLVCPENIAKENIGVVTRSKTKVKTCTSEKNLKCEESTAKQVLLRNAKVNFKNKFCKIDIGKIKSLDSYKFNPPKSVQPLPLSSKLTCPNSQNLSNKTKILSSVLKDSYESENKNLNMLKCTSSIVKLTPQRLTKNVNQDSDEIQSSAEQVIFEKENSNIINYSPFTPGRKNKSAENENKIHSCASSNKNSTNENDEFQYNIFLFRKYLEFESKKLLDKCEAWKHIYQELGEIPEDVEGEINSIVGKTQLLTSDKFMQFKSLIDKCEAGDPLVKIEDLQGFQDWISIEVERIDNDFCKLEKRKQNNWVAESIAIKKSKTTKKKKKVIGKSDIRSHINAIRKMQKNQETTVSSSNISFKFPLMGEENLTNDALNLQMPAENLKKVIVMQKNKLHSPEKLHGEIDECIAINKSQSPTQGLLKKKPCSLNSLKTQFIYEQGSENIKSRTKGINEKYFKPPTEDKNTPKCFILRDLNVNTTPSKIGTRSQIIQ